MSERKKVVIDLEESERVHLGKKSELNNIDASGVLSVNNVSDRSRIWNVKVHLGETRGATDLSEEKLVAGEIDAGGKWEANYGLSVGSPILTFKEMFDTCSTIETDEPHWAYVKNKENPVKITFTINNETDGEIDNIILNKTIPPELSNIEIASVKSGTAEFDEGTKQVVWKDFVVYPRESTSLVLRATGNVEDAQPKKAGDVVITYRGEEQQKSKLNPNLTALTEFLTGIETAETEPNQWQCTLECSNESDLIVRLDKAEVYLTPEEGGEKQKMIEETPGVELEPDQEWTSSFEVESKSTPKCTQDIIYTPVGEIKKRVIGTIKKEPQEIPVYSIDYTKTFDPSSVSSFDKTPVEVTIEVTNNGSAKLNEVTIEDNLPDDVMPPTSEHVTVWIRDEEYTGPFEFVIDPEDQDPERPHKISFRLEGLKDSVGELESGESLKINYAIMAWRSRPEKEYPSPVTCTANTEPAGIPAVAASPDDGHKLGVIYKKRAISTKKAINKGAGAGEYIVVLVVSNSGEVTAENIEVSDWIPSGFEYVSTDPEEDAPEVSTVADGSKMVWTWTRMNPGDKKKLRVTVQGEGEYERREPEVTSI